MCEFRNQDNLLRIKLLGDANRRHDLSREAAIYFDTVSATGYRPEKKDIGRPSQLAWRSILTCLGVLLIAAAIFLGVRGANSAIWAIVFVASMLASVVGFAFAAIAAAILFHVDNNHLHAVQTMLVASISLQSYSVFCLRTNLDLRLLAPFLLGGGVMLLPGVYIATHIRPELLLIVIGTFLVLYGIYTLIGRIPRLRFPGVAGDICAGAFGGIMGPVAAIPGPFVTISCSLKGWDKSRQRGVYQTYILIMQMMTLAALFLMNGSTVPIDWPVFQFAIPAIAGAFCGLKIFERLNDKQFLSAVAVFFVVSGLSMMVKGL
jgi:uncharacterized membrane protein YfcA